MLTDHNQNMLCLDEFDILELRAICDLNISSVLSLRHNICRPLSLRKINRQQEKLYALLYLIYLFFHSPN